MAVVRIHIQVSCFLERPHLWLQPIHFTRTIRL